MPAARYTHADAYAADAWPAPGTQLDRRDLRFLAPADQSCGAPIELVRDIEQLLRELIRRHARQQHAANV